MSALKNMFTVVATVFTVFAIGFAAVCAADELQGKRSKLFVRMFEGRAFVEHDLFQTTVRSGLECSLVCASDVCCRSFTYGVTDGTCGGHSTDRTETDAATSVPGMTTFNAIGEQEEINVALGKNASQSSTINDFPASNAVDGNNTSSTQYGTCSRTAMVSTQGDTPVWWQVDLGQSYCIKSVKITNPSNSFWSNKVLDFDIHVYATDPATNPTALVSLCSHQTGTREEDTRNFLCTPCPLCGRFVRITNGGDQQLTLCEVEVLAILPTV